MKTLPLFNVVNTPEMEAAAIEVLRSGRIGNGEYVAQFEAGLGRIIGQPNVVSTVDMTSALFLALYLAGVKDGDEVITTAFACMATNSAIAQRGAVPVWADVKPRSVEMDVSDFISKITAKTKAVILYHVGGYPGPAKEIASLAKQRGIAMIEDCNSALFATREGAPVGSHGDFAVYSFYPTRQINTTEGGALVCNSADMATRARKLRRFGIDPAKFRDSNGEINPASDIPEIGWAFTMNNLCAALGCAQLPSAAGRVVKTRENAEKLARKIGGFHGLKLIPVPSESEPAYWFLLLFVDNRDDVLKSMKRQGIHVSSVHQRNDVYTGFHAGPTGNLPNTSYLQNHVLAVPCGWWLSEKDLDAIAVALEKALMADAAA